MALRSLGAGQPGKSVELRTTQTAIQWRQSGGPWADLVPLAALAGAPGRSAYDVAVANGYTGTAAQWLASLVGPAVEMQASATAIQWRAPGGTWADLVALSALRGPAGFVLVGSVTVGQSGLVLAGGIRELTVALAGTVVGERYAFFARAYTLNGGASVKGRPPAYAVVDCVCNTAGQITVSLNAPALTVLTGYTITGDVLRAVAT